LSATAVGTYHVACLDEATGAVDAEGATLTVTAGAPTVVRPVFDENPVAAGVATGVRCVTADAYGNEVAALGTPAGDAPLVFANGQVSSEQAGEFEVRCDVEGNPGLTRQTARLTVLAGDVASLHLLADPEKDAYLPGAVVRLYWTATDRYGNEVANAPGTLTAPANAVELDAAQHKYRLDEDGSYRFSVTLDAPLPRLTAEKTLVVDGAAPTITITWPERGATVQGTAPSVTIKGVVTDGAGSGVTAFMINGDNVAIGADGSFEHPMKSGWGLNMINAYARDGAGNEEKITPTFLYSSAFTPFVNSDARGLQQPDGMVMLLGQDFLDDGVHDPQHIDDLATLLELALGQMDLRGALTGTLSQLNQTIPLADYSWTIGIDNVSWLAVTLHGDLDITAASVEPTAVGTTHVGIDSRPGGLDFDMTIGDAARHAIDIAMELNVHASFTLEADACSFIGCLPVLDTEVYGDATLMSGLSLASLTMRLHTDVSKTAAGPLNVAFRDYDVQLSGLDIDPVQDVVFSLGVVNFPGVGNQTLTFPLSQFIDLNSLIGSILDPVTGLLTTVLPAILNPLIEGFAGPLIGGLFDAIEIDTSFPVPALLGERDGSYDIDFYTDLSTVTFTDDGGTIGLSTGIYADKGENLDRDPLGAIRRAGCLTGSDPALSWGWSPSVGIGIKTDVINAAFFGAWWTGYLNGPLPLDLGGSGALPIPIDNAQLELSWLLPPVLNDCQKGGLGLQVGDLFVTLTGDIGGSPVRVTMYADLGLAASFVTGEDGLSMQIGQLEFADFEVIEEDAGALGDVFDLRALVEDGLPGIISGFLVGQEFGPFNLPPTDLSATNPNLPPGTSVGLGNLSVSSPDGYVVIGGDLE
ncbi:MAG: hypothetical protein H6745_29825, partial [Deltaproteobacteria bacterium]|nr:hypothetical protein [Deltaproteobacteria bacterium]